MRSWSITETGRRTVVNAASFDGNLALAVEDLSNEVKGLKRQLRINQMWRNSLVALALFMCIAIAVLGVVLVKVYDTQHKVNATRTLVLCPLYTIFVQQVDLPRQPQETDTQYAERLAVRKQMHDSYTTLKCQPPLK